MHKSHPNSLNSRMLTTEIVHKSVHFCITQTCARATLAPIQMASTGVATCLFVRICAYSW